MDERLKKLQQSSDYRELVKEYNKSRIPLTIAMLIVYYTFISIIGFSPDVFAAKLFGGETSWGILAGFLVIIFTFIVTGAYVKRANKHIEPKVEQLRKDAEELTSGGM